MAQVLETNQLLVVDDEEEQTMRLLSGTRHFRRLKVMAATAIALLGIVALGLMAMGGGPSRLMTSDHLDTSHGLNSAKMFSLPPLPTFPVPSAEQIRQASQGLEKKFTDVRHGVWDYSGGRVMRWAEKKHLSARQFVQETLTEGYDALKDIEELPILQHSSRYGEAIQKLGNLSGFKSLSDGVGKVVKDLLNDDKMYSDVMEAMGKNKVETTSGLFHSMWKRVAHGPREIADAAKLALAVVTEHFAERAEPVAFAKRRNVSAMVSEIQSTEEALSGMEAAFGSRSAWHYVAGCVNPELVGFQVTFCIYFLFDSSGPAFDKTTYEVSIGVQLPDELGVCAAAKIGKLMTDDASTMSGGEPCLSIGIDGAMPLDAGGEFSASPSTRDFSLGICGAAPMPDLPAEGAMSYGFGIQPHLKKEEE